MAGCIHVNSPCFEATLNTTKLVRCCRLRATRLSNFLTGNYPDEGPIRRPFSYLVGCPNKDRIKLGTMYAYYDAQLAALRDIRTLTVYRAVDGESLIYIRDTISSKQHRQDPSKNSLFEVFFFTGRANWDRTPWSALPI